jgi:hypothetical protein
MKRIAFVDPFSSPQFLAEALETVLEFMFTGKATETQTGHSGVNE